MLKVDSQIMPFHTLLKDGNIQMYIFLWQIEQGESDVLASSLHIVNCHYESNAIVLSPYSQLTEPKGGFSDVRIQRVVPQENYAKDT